MSADEKKLPPMHLLADTDPRKAKVEQVAALLRTSRMPGKLSDAGTETIDASFEALALEVHASSQQCFLCKQDVLEFVIWRVMCEHCDLEILRCRNCDPDGTLAKQSYVTHCETAHPDLFVECVCGLVTMHVRRMTCPEEKCSFEVVRCRERCDCVAALAQHRVAHEALR